MSDLLDRVRLRGWRLTAQRRVVAQSLAGDNVHLTAEGVHERAVALLPEISRATVYNTLNELVAMGEVAVVVPDGRANRYDPNVVDPHHHLHCTHCGALEDVQAINVDKLGIVHPDHGFEVDGVDVVFKGVCPACGQE
ncbi:MAG: Fur family transcriptional regulator [Acidimicrobiales bacterium]